MRVLLDTNIVIHRENIAPSNYSIGHLYYWLDRLKCTKLVHSYSVKEIMRFCDDEKRLEALKIKIQAYEVLKTVPRKSIEFEKLLKAYSKNDNDLIDDSLLNEVYLLRVDYLITEDRKMLRKAHALGIGDRVFSINQFITMVSGQNPDLISYKVLSVKKCFFGEINIDDEFFNSFKNDYQGFEKWFASKCDEEAYVCIDEGKLLGFLYLKKEDEGEIYNDISPSFLPARRLKIGTFKVESTGFRLGERFIKIILDNAVQFCVDEIYVTMFNERSELEALGSLLERWGFVDYGKKISHYGTEKVLVKKMKTYNSNLTTKQNFPNIRYSVNKFILPIEKKYHTDLLPDSILAHENQVEFVESVAHRYALEKVYISFSYKRDMKSGDLVLFYRKGEEGNAKYTGVITTLGVIDSIRHDFKSKKEFFDECQNRSIFTKEELEDIWNRQRNKILIVKFLYLGNLNKKVILDYLWKKNIVSIGGGPRPFDQISDVNYDSVLEESNTQVKTYC